MISFSLSLGEHVPEFAVDSVVAQYTHGRAVASSRARAVCDPQDYVERQEWFYTGDGALNLGFSGVFG